jgi:hypothetical protein
MCIGSDECDCDDFDEETDEFFDEDFNEERDGDDDDLRNNIDGVGFADPGGRSALRAETIDNPRMYPCPTCGTENRLTAIDVQHGYQCDDCSDKTERGF